ncbi:MAG: protein-export chaperone SecB [Desulfobacteraceae bacterium]|nr:protein-export chaperone SecB [Desulfobacteraceae bacterium]
MAEDKNDKQEEQANPADTPVFKVQKLYLKDLSFENPNAPEIFLAGFGEPKVDINLGIKNRKLNDDHWEVTLSVTAKIAKSDEDKTLFIIEVEHAGIFLLRNIPEQHLPAVLAVECPTLMYPFTRQIISQVSVDGGFMPFLIEPVNFMALFEAQRRRQAEQQGQQPTQ